MMTTTIMMMMMMMTIMMMMVIMMMMMMMMMVVVVVTMIWTYLDISVSHIGFIIRRLLEKTDYYNTARIRTNISRPLKKLVYICSFRESP